MFKKVKNLFKKEEKEEKFHLLGNDVDEEEDFVYQPADEDLWDVFGVKEEIDEADREYESLRRRRFQEVKDNLGNRYLEVKEPAMWVPGTNNDFYVWCEESNFSTKKFNSILEWVNTEARVWKPFEEEHEDDVFFERTEEDPDAGLSEDGEGWDNPWKRSTEEWAEKTAKVGYTVEHYNIEEFEADWLEYEKYEATVPDDFERFHQLTTEEMALPLDKWGY